MYYRTSKYTYVCNTNTNSKNIDTVRTKDVEAIVHSRKWGRGLVVGCHRGLLCEQDGYHTESEDHVPDVEGMEVFELFVDCRSRIYHLTRSREAAASSAEE